MDEINPADTATWYSETVEVLQHGPQTSLIRRPYSGATFWERNTALGFHPAFRLEVLDWM